MYVCMYVAIRRPRVHHARAHTYMYSACGNDHYRIKYVHIQWVMIVNVIICMRAYGEAEGEPREPRKKEVLCNMAKQLQILLNSSLH